MIDRLLNLFYFPNRKPTYFFVFCLLFLRLPISYAASSTRSWEFYWVGMFFGGSRSARFEGRLAAGGGREP